MHFQLATHLNTPNMHNQLYEASILKVAFMSYFSNDNTSVAISIRIPFIRKCCRY